MMKRSKWLREWGVSALILLLAWQAISLWQQSGLIATAQPAPNFRLPTLAGDELQLDQITTEQTLLYFFAPWCSICKLSIGNLNQLQDPTVTVIAVALAYDSPQAVADFVAGQSLNLPVVLGDSRLQQAYGIDMFPTYYVLDRNKRVSSKAVGYSTALGLKARIF